MRKCFNDYSLFEFNKLCLSCVIVRQRDDGSVDGVVSTIPQQLSAGSQQPVDQDALRIELSSLKAYCDKLNDEKTHALQETNVLKVLVNLLY